MRQRRRLAIFVIRENRCDEDKSDIDNATTAKK